MMFKVKSSEIEKKLPLLCWDNGCLISKRGDITALFELDLSEVFTMHENDYDGFHAAWSRAIRIMPENSIVHKQDFFLEDRWSAGGDDKGRTFLSSASDRHFIGRPYLRHKCYLYLTLCTRISMKTSSFSSFLCLDNPVIQEQIKGPRVSDFLDKVDQFAQVLSSSSIPCRRLGKDEVIGTPEHFGLLEHYLCLSFDDKACLPDYNVTDIDFLSGDNFISCFSVSDLPDLPQSVATCTRDAKYSSSKPFYDGLVHPLCFGPRFSHIYNQYFFIDVENEIVKKIEQQGKWQLSLSRVSRENAINKEYNDQYLDERIAKSRKPVRCSFNIMFWDKSYSNLQKKNSIVGAFLVGMDCTANKTVSVVPQMFWGGIPGAASQYPSDMTFLTFIEQGCCFINHETNYRSSKSGFGIRLCDRPFGVPVKVDISDEPRQRGWTDNRNKFILGPSGSGKSFFTNHLMRQYYEQGAHVVIVDVGDSYLGLCKQIQQESGGRDGIYYTYTEQHPISFNPFYVADNVYTVEKREQLTSLIFCLWKSESETITKAEETHVSVAIGNYCGKVVNGELEPCFDTFYDYLSMEYRDYIKAENIRIDNFDIDNLVQVLSPYHSSGQYGYLLNAKENLDLLHKRFIVFEIDNIKDHKTLFPVVTLILMDTFISKMRSAEIGGERKVILIEEAWKAISKTGTAEFIKYLYKTVRKHFGEAMVVTQEVDDIIDNPIVKESIIANADCKILLDQRKYANKFEIVQEILALTDKEASIALSLNRVIDRKGRNPYKEVFITLNGNYTAAYAVEVSKEEYLTYTTEKKEKVHLFDLEKKYGSISKAITAYIAETGR